MTIRQSILVGAAALAVLTGTGGFRACAYAHVAPRRAMSKAPHGPVAQAPHNPLLPVQFPAEDFWPQLWVMQRLPAYVPKPFELLYTHADWHAYQRVYGGTVKNMYRLGPQGRTAFAQRLVLAADKMPLHSSMARLLLTRAVALTFRYRSGFPVCEQAVIQYLRRVQLSQAAQVGALWAMADAMAWQNATPPDMRINCDRLAEQADVKLTLDLVKARQLRAALTLVRLMPRHAALAIRQDPLLFGQMNMARNLVLRTRVMMHYLAGQYRAIAHGAPSAALPLYLYARFVHPMPAMRARLINWQPGGLPANLERAMDLARHDPDQLYMAARLLTAAAHDLPSGIIRDRTLYQACIDYHRYIFNRMTRRHRVKRTLARIHLQHVLAEGASPAPGIHPFHDTWLGDPFAPKIVPPLPARTMAAGSA